MKKNLFFTIMLLFTLIGSIIAQERTITGTVTSKDDGAPLPGVNVLVVGTQRGTITNSDGKYSINVPTSATQLEFSFVGMKTQTISIGNRSVINVTMETETKNMGEVVVTALGIKRKEKTLTYATQTVGADELTRSKDINFANSLSGKISGVDIKENSSGAGGSTKIILRGNKSIKGASEPLIVVDGIPLVNRKGSQPGMWGGTDHGDGLSEINPEDIASINVLKGSNAAVLYGSQGANGVILITTKKGHKGATRVTLSSGYIFKNVISLPDLQFEYGSEGSKENWSYTKGDYSSDFVKDFFRTGHNAINSVTVSGGNDKTTAYLSYTNTSSIGVTPDNKYNKNNFTFKQSTKVFKKITVSSNVMLSDERTHNRPGSGYYLNPLTGLYFFPRDRDFNDYKVHYQVFDDTRNMYLQNWFVEDHHQSNPYWIIYNEPKDDRIKRVIGNITVKYQISDNLSLQVRGNDDFSIKKFERKHKAGSNSTNVGENGAWEYKKFTDELIYGDVLLTYDKKFNNISVNAVLGTSYQETTYGKGVSVNTGTTGLRYPNEFYFQNIDENVLVNSTLSSREIKEGVFGNIQLGYKDMLFLDLSGRNDWASTLIGTGNDSYFYPSVGLSGLVNEMINLPEFISFGKVRSSYTIVANEVPFNIVHPGNTITSTGVQMNTTKPFNNMRPEMLRSFEAGTDWRFFKGRIGIDFTYYNINSQDQFIRLPAPSGSGYTTYYVNAGKIVNSGIELTLNAKPVQFNNFHWNTSLNYSDNKNKIVALHPDLKNPINLSNSEGYQLIIKEGGSFGDLYVFKFKRDDQGRLMLDEKGNLLKTDKKEYIGNSNPDWILGWNNNFTYKQFSFSFLVNGKFGGKVISQTEAMLDGYGSSKRTAVARDNGGVAINAVMPDGTPVTKMDAKKYYRTTGGRNGIKEPYTYDRTNIRLTQVSLAYNLNLEKTGLMIKQASFSIVGGNLFFLYKKAPFDPELVMNTTNAYQSLDNFNLPARRNIGFNIKLTF